MSNLDVADTIQEQLGRKALVMLGARGFLGTENSLQFKVGRNAKSVTNIKVTLDPSDTYTIEFTRRRFSHKTGILDVNVLAKVVDVYVEDLHRIIEIHTGLYTSL